MMDLLLLFVLPACLATAFLCSGMEAGVFTLGRWRIAQQMRAGRRQAARLYAYLQKTENFLWTILVGNTLAAFFAMWILAVALWQELGASPWQFWGAYLLCTFVFYGFCDLLPKTLFRKFPNRLCLVMSGPFRLLDVVLSPLVEVVEGIASGLLRWTGGRAYQGDVFSSRSELRLLMDDTGQSLSSEERGMINRVLDLHNRTIRQLAIPFARFPLLTTEDSLKSALARFRESGQNILPVWTQGVRPRRIAGFFELKRFLFAEPGAGPGERLDRCLSPAFYLEENARVHDALRRMQRGGQRMAIVLSSDRREIGLVTLEEILQAMFGEVRL